MKKSVILAGLGVALSLLLVACAPKAPETSSPQSDSPDQATWSADMECVGCHADHATSLTEPGAGHEGLAADCVTCHEKDSVVEVHEQYGDSGREPSRLRYSTVPNEGCVSSGCHEGVGLPGDETCSVTVTDDDGVAKRPHEVLSQTGHEDIKCINCHSMHKAPDDMQAQAEDTCFGCHHKKKFECGTCHS